MSSVSMTSKGAAMCCPERLPGRRVDRLPSGMIRVAAGQSMIRDPSESGQKPAPRSRRKWLVAAFGLLLLGGACVATGGPGPDAATVAPPPDPGTGTSPPFSAAAFIPPHGAPLPLRQLLPKGQPQAVIPAV